MKIKGKDFLFLKLSEFVLLEKIPENRPSGAETEEECKKYHYSKQEVDAEKKWLLCLRKNIMKQIHDGEFENIKVFILGEFGGKLYLMDGQHTGVIYKELIEKNIFSEDTLDFVCLVYKYTSYQDMISSLSPMNEAKSWKKSNHSRLESMEAEGRKIYEKMADKYYDKIDDGVIKHCLFRQSNGEDLFKIKIFPAYQELIELTLYFQEECKKHCLSKNDIARLSGTNHCATAVRDLMRLIFRETLNTNKKYYDSLKENSSEEWKKDGTRICKELVGGILGDNALSSTNWSAFGAADLFKVNHNAEFKKQFSQRYKDGAIRLFKRSTTNVNKDIKIFETALDCWIKLNKKG